MTTRLRAFVEDDARDARLQDAVASARAAHPEIEVSEPQFLAYVRERIGTEPRTLDGLHAADLLVAYGCVHGDSAALAQLERLVSSAVPAAVRRIDPAPTFVDDIQQLTRMHLTMAPDEASPCRLAKYQGRGKLRSWVQVAAVRLALEERRRRRPDEVRNDEGIMEAAGCANDPELEHLRLVCREQVANAFKQALATIAPRQRIVLRMHLLDGLSIDEIAAVYHVHRATAARWIGAAREAVCSDARQRLRRSLRISEREFESLMGVVRGQLDLSLERFLGEGHA